MHDLKHDRSLLDENEVVTPWANAQPINYNKVESYHSNLNTPFLDEINIPSSQSRRSFETNIVVGIPLAEDQQMKGYEDPLNSGFPLRKIIDDKMRKEKLSKNFTIGEFAQAGEGRYKWDYYRVDLDLIKELQKLRDVLKKLITIVDGYYPPKYYKEVLHKKIPQINPHFSGQGVKIKSPGMSGKELAQYIIQNCDKNLSIAVGDQTVAIYNIKQKLPRISSYIKDPRKKSDVIRFLMHLDSNNNSIQIDVGKPFSTLAPWLVQLSAPANDPRYMTSDMQKVKDQASEIVSILDKFLLGTSKGVETNTIIKSIKNVRSFNDHLFKDEKIRELIKNDQIQLDFASRIRLFKSSLNFLENINNLKSISEKFKAYDEFVKNNALASTYLLVDIFQYVTKLTSDTVNIGIAIACLYTKDLALKKQLLELALKLEKVFKSLFLAIESVKVIRSIINIIIGIARNDKSAIKNNLSDLAMSVGTILTMYLPKLNALGTAIYLYVRAAHFVFISLSEKAVKASKFMIWGTIVQKLQEIESRFKVVTRMYLDANFDYESLEIVKNYPAQYQNFTALHREIYSFEEYIIRRPIYIKERIYTSDAQMTLLRIKDQLKNFPKNYQEFEIEHPVYVSALNNYYTIYYEGIVKCYLEIAQIVEEIYDQPRNHKSQEIEKSDFTISTSNELEINNWIPEVDVELLSRNNIHENLLLSVPISKKVFVKSVDSNILNPIINKKNTEINKEQLAKSGLQASELLKAISKYIDIGSVKVALKSYNLNSTGAYLVDESDFVRIDAVFTESIHQFQMANYLDFKEHDGIIGQSTVETLGFTNHLLRQPITSSNFYGQHQLNHIKSDVAAATHNEFKASNWFDFIVKPSWLGIKIADGIHVLLMRKLREAEEWLLSQPQYQGKTPVELGKALGLNRIGMRYSGARLSSTKQAMHSFGLAIDIDPTGNPWIGAGWIQNDKEKMQERTRMIEIFEKASGENLSANTIFAYLHSIALSTGADTKEAFNKLKQKNDEFINYLNNNPAELKYWEKSATFSNRNPLNGFLNLPFDLVYALREKAGLAWGAIDFGPRASGDIMHFDIRTIGVGKIIAKQIKGYIPQTGHPTISQEVLNYMEEYHEAIEETEWETNEYLEEKIDA